MPSDHVRPVAEGVLVEYQQAPEGLSERNDWRSLLPTHANRWREAETPRREARANSMLACIEALGRV